MPSSSFRCKNFGKTIDLGADIYNYFIVKRNFCFDLEHHYPTCVLCFNAIISGSSILKIKEITHGQCFVSEPFNVAGDMGNTWELECVKIRPKRVPRSMMIVNLHCILLPLLPYIIRAMLIQ